MSARAGTLAPETNAVLGHVPALLECHEALDEACRYAATLSAPAHEFWREATVNAVSALNKPEYVTF